MSPWSVFALILRSRAQTNCLWLLNGISFSLLKAFHGKCDSLGAFASKRPSVRAQSEWAPWSRNDSLGSNHVHDASVVCSYYDVAVYSYVDVLYVGDARSACVRCVHSDCQQVCLYWRMYSDHHVILGTFHANYKRRNYVSHIVVIYIHGTFLHYVYS